jgi:polar amino acid transport system substrate-binding protein
MNFDRSVVTAFAPTGKLRASINLGNPILANRDPHSGEPVGVSVDLARAFAQHLSVDLELVVFDAARKSFEAVSEERADIGFFAIDPLRGQAIAFTAPYVLIEGFYLVHNDSPITTNQDVDQQHNRVAVGRGSAYDLFLSRELKAAQIVRAPTSPTVVQTFLEQHLEVAAGVKQQLEADSKKLQGVRLLNERFMVIQQAMGTPKTRGVEAAAALAQFVEEMKVSGVVSASLDRHGIAGASVAPLV